MSIVAKETSIDNESECKIVHNALTAIAKEMQTYQNSVSNCSSTDYTAHENMFYNLLQCKTTLKSKNKIIKNLKNKLNTACVVANTAMVTRDRNNARIVTNLNNTKSECTDILQKNTNTKEVTNALTKKNKALINELENLANFIELCYRELQDIRNEKYEDVSVIQQLKKIIICCGQYYADYQNEHQKNKQLEQKYCFMSSKFKILNKNLDAVTEELKNLRFHNMRLRSESNILKEKLSKVNNGISLCTSEHQIYNKNSCNHHCMKDDPSDIYLQSCNLDLKPHLRIVRKLLSDQDELIKDFKILSDMTIV